MAEDATHNRILIVDDDRVTRQTLANLLTAEGYAVSLGDDGEQAIALARELLPDLLILDILLPGKDGYEVCRALRRDPLLAEVPIVLLTALDDRASRIRGLEVGADDFLSKPFDRVELLARVGAITRLNRFRRLQEERQQLQQTAQELGARLHDLEVLNALILRTSESLDEAEVLQVGAAALAEAFAPARTLIHRVDEDGQGFTLLAQALAPAGEGSAPPPAVATVSVLLDPDCANTLRRAPQAYLVSPGEAGPWGSSRAHLLVPLKLRDRLSGVLELVPEASRRFRSHDVGLAESIGSAVSQAWGRAQLYRELQRYAETLEETVGARTQELAAERDRIRAILEALGEAAFVTDAAGTVQYVNPAAADLTGYEREELVGVHLNRWHPDRRVERVFERLAQSPDCPLPELWWEGELVGRRKDGTYFDAMLTIAPLPAPQAPARAIGFVGVQRDITPLKEAERMKHRFASNVSHELRTPLSVITLLSGNLDALGDRITPDKRSAMIKDIRRHAQVLDELITDVLEMSSIDSGRLSSDLQVLDLAPLLRDEMQRLTPLAERRSQHLSAGGDASLMVRGDGRQLRRIVRNLVNNAVKYTPEGGHIDCHWQAFEVAAPGQALEGWPGAERLEAGHWAGMRIRDDGMGIDMADHERIFERFYRVNSQSNVPGTGLGLAITRELVALHSGRVALASAIGQGSTFAVYLPVSS